MIVTLTRPFALDELAGVWMIMDDLFGGSLLGDDVCSDGGDGTGEGWKGKGQEREGG